MRDRESRRGKTSQRVADQRRLLNTNLFVKGIEKIDKRRNTVVQHRLVRLTEADLIRHQHPILHRKRGDGWRPVRSASSKPVKKDDSGSAACLEIVNLGAEHRRVLVGDRGI